MDDTIDERIIMSYCMKERKIQSWKKLFENLGFQWLDNFEIENVGKKSRFAFEAKGRKLANKMEVCED